MAKFKRLGRRHHGKPKGKTSGNKKKTASGIKLGNKRLTKLIRRGEVKSRSTYLTPYQRAKKQQQAQFKQRVNQGDVDLADQEVSAEDVMDMLPKKELKRLQSEAKRNKWFVCLFHLSIMIKT